MSTITTRAGKGSPLTNAEVDANFENLNADKLESVSQSDVTQHQAALSITESQISDLDKYTQQEVDDLLASLEAYDQSLNTTDDVAFASVQLTGGTGEEGTLSWNDSDRTLDLDQGGVTLQLGQEMHMMVRNATGSSIGNGTFLGFTGVTVGSNRVMAGPFDTSTMGAHMLVGFATENISNGVNGFVTTFGYVRELDTRGDTASNMAVGDETWAVGDLLYPHPTVAGKLTKVAPTSGLKVSVAVITNRHATQGEIFVRVTALDENAYATAAQGALADSALQSETDPVFTAWDKSTGISITESQISDFGSYQPAGSYITTATTFGGDVSGTYNAIVVADDSHNHIIANVDGLQAALDGKVDDAQVLTNVPAGAVFTDTTYSVGNGGLTEINFTSALNSKLAGIEAGATGDQSAAEILAAIKTVDGGGSGLDADLLDGQHASSFAASGHNHTLDSLSNTTITSNTAGEILKWNGSAWINNTLAEAGIQPAGSYLTGNQTITLTGDASGSGTTSIAVTVNNDSHSHSTSTITGLGALATLSAVGAAQITDNSVGAAELNVSGNGTAGQLLASDGDGTMSWVTPESGGGGSSTSYFTSSGTWTKPSGINKVEVEIMGGGGGGSAVQSNNTSGGQSGSGGGAGGYGYAVYDVTNINSVAITVGSGGSGGSGSTGGASSFGTYITANGGEGGGTQNDTGRAACANGNIVGGTSFTVPAKQNATSSYGASSLFGTGGNNNGTANTNGNGNAASIYGSGGGPGWVPSAINGQMVGGAGSAGFVIVRGLSS